MGLNKLEIGVIQFEGSNRAYDVIERNLSSPAPRYFISYNMGRPFISDEVPEEYREPMVFHELTEFEKLNGTEGRCLTSLRRELNTLPENLIRDYIVFRRQTFDELIKFLEKYDPNSSAISGAKESLEFLAQFNF